MEKLSPELEQRVWERVSGGQCRPDLRGMELRCRESAAVFHQMAAQTRGSTREILTELHRQEQEAGEVIRGMRVLAGEEPEKRRNYGGHSVTLPRGLAQSLRRSREAWEDYATHAQNQDYGPVFSILCTREAEKMQKILSLIGNR